MTERSGALRSAHSGPMEPRVAPRRGSRPRSATSQMTRCAARLRALLSVIAVRRNSAYLAPSEGAFRSRSEPPAEADRAALGNLGLAVSPDGEPADGLSEAQRRALQLCGAARSGATSEEPTEVASCPLRQTPEHSRQRRPAAPGPLSSIRGALSCQPPGAVVPRALAGPFAACLTAVFASLRLTVPPTALAASGTSAARPLPLPRRASVTTASCAALPLG